MTAASGVDENTTAEAAHKVRALIGRKQLKTLMVRKDGPGLLFLAGHLALLALFGSLLWHSLGSHWALAAAFAQGLVIVHFFAPFHEATHGTAFRSAWLNQAVGWFAGLALMLPPRVFKYLHADHHSYTQQIGRDPQMIAMGERLSGYLFYASSVPYHLSNLTALIRHLFGRLDAAERRAVPAQEQTAVQREAMVFWAVYLALALESLWFQSWALVILWLIPRMIAEPVMRIIRMAEHVACPRVPDMLRNSRTVKCAAPIRWLAWNMPLHTAHHAVPSVPFHALPALNEILEPHAGEVRDGYLATVRAQVRNAIHGGS